MFGYKNVVAAVAAAAMISSSAFAADGALAPGKPAGVQKAQIGTGTLILGLAGAAVMAAVAIMVSNQSGSNPTAADLRGGDHVARRPVIGLTVLNIERPAARDGRLFCALPHDSWLPATIWLPV